MNKKVNIILLNGISSAGKTSIAKALQEKLDEPYLHTGADHFFAMLPIKYMSAHHGIDCIIDKNGSILKVHFGKVSKQLKTSMQKAILVLANDGFNIVIDEVILQNELEEYIKNFKDYNFISVGILAPLEVIEKREKERGDRMLGLARRQYDIVHKDQKYDLEVNTSKSSSQECAEQIIQILKESN